MKVRGKKQLTWDKENECEENALKWLCLGQAVCLMYNYTQHCPRVVQHGEKYVCLTCLMVTARSEKEWRKESCFECVATRIASMVSHEAGALHYPRVMGWTITFKTNRGLLTPQLLLHTLRFFRAHRFWSPCESVLPWVAAIADCWRKAHCLCNACLCVSVHTQIWSIAIRGLKWKAPPQSSKVT